jgi:protein-S-isoprenylcysteine O-methyltransferase Ste14
MRLYRGVGWTLVGTGVAISQSAVRAASGVDLRESSTLISSGPYAIRRALGSSLMLEEPSARKRKLTC